MISQVARRSTARTLSSGRLMASAVKTTVTELPESRVRVDAEVAPDELERSMQRTARQLGASMRIRGFRKGKVPPPVVIRRIGREAVLDETARDAIGRWYVDAISAADIAPVGDPKLDLGDMPPEGEPLTFTIEIGVRPTAELGDYEGIEVGAARPRSTRPRSRPRSSSCASAPLAWRPSS